MLTALALLYAFLNFWESGLFRTVRSLPRRKRLAYPAQARALGTGKGD